MTVTPLNARRPADDDALAVPPHDIDTERALLGSMMLSADSLAICLPMVTEGSFLRPAHQLVLGAIAALAGRGDPVDWLTVKAELERRGDLMAAGGPMVTHDLKECVPAAIQGPHYARRLLELQSQRDHGVLGHRVLQLAADGNLSPAERHQRVSALVDDLADAGRSETRVHTAASLVGPLMESLEAGPDSVPGIPSGWADLNRIIPGFRPAEVTVIGGRPGMGKSVVLLNIATHAALRLRRHVLAITLEMTAEQYMERLIAAEAGVELSHIRERQLSDWDWDRLAKAHEAIAEADTLHIYEGYDLSPQGIRAELRAMRRAGTPAELLTLDYLQLMEDAMRRESRQLEVSGLSRALKTISGEWKIPVLVGSQLNRGPDLRTEHRPGKADLRESGAIENDADNVILLYRDEAYNAESAHAGEIELIVAKNRQGAEATATLAWRGNVASCDDLYREWTSSTCLEGNR